MNNEDFIRANFFSSCNFGDGINPFIINKLSGKQVSLYNKGKHYVVCGSILSISNKDSVAWGAGFDWGHHRNRDLNGCENVIAVRGELTAKNCGLDVKYIGDPALLLPILYPQEAKPRYTVGIIPHWSTIEKCCEVYKGEFIINPLIPMSEFINNILSCEHIFSESLHGLIVSDAYGIPNAWLSIDDSVSNGFKYSDYYSSTETPDIKKTETININDCMVHKYKYDIKEFLNSCPFLNKEIWT